MTTISPYSQLLAAIRAQRQGASSSAASASRMRRAGESRALVGGEPAQGAIAALSSRVMALRGDDPLRRHKALRMFVEASLLDGFGAAHVSAPDFQELVDRTTLTLEAEPELQPLLKEALQELLD